MSEALVEIKLRCEVAGIEYEEQGRSLLIRFPSGRETYDQYVEDGLHAKWVASQPFEDYVRLERFQASWSSKYQVIECNIVPTEPQGVSPFATERMLISKIVRYLSRQQGRNEINSKEMRGKVMMERFRELQREIREEEEQRWNPRPDPPPDPSDEAQRVSFEPVNDLSISIGHSSNVHSFVQGNHGVDFDPEEEIVLDVGRSLTLQIRGTDVTNHDSAVELLERVGNSLLFQIDLSYGLGLTLRHEQRHGSNFLDEQPISPHKDKGPLPPVQYQYDREAMALYWYARASTAMPLLQFLAYYQILEFYFAQYSQQKVIIAIRNIIKDPRFNPSRDLDIGRIVEGIRVTKRGGVGDERKQLLATIEHCVEPNDLREFFMSNEDRYAFYDSEHQLKLASEKISLRGPSFDHRREVAKRIYEIRCRIVHTKAGTDDNQGPLFPFDPEIKYLDPDLELIEFLAQKVLIDASLNHPLAL